MLLLFVCLILGTLVARFAKPPAGIVPGINWWVLNVALPALVLELIPKVKFDPQLWFPVAAMWLTFGGAWLLFGLLGPRLGWSRQRTGALILVCGLGNTAYMGYPMVQALHGKAGLALAVVADQIGAFPVLASAGIVVASLYSGRTPRLGPIVRRILTFPAFVALLAGIVAGLCGGWPVVLEGVFAPVGATLTPLALFSVGLQFKFHPGQRQLGAAGWGLGWKLLLAPLACWAMGKAAGVGGLVLTVGVLQAAMAPMVSAAILADEYELEPTLANTVLGAGIVLSLLTVPLGNLLLGA
ncbi:transporter [Rhodanobacter sp. FW510-R12]|uniref:AEC family transporter n=1 Tax=unclassified Rhodanobacter TaxID=2621553 RepID=UPI0007AA4964|nr:MULTISPECIES: AEC family transporter [unclassified Rhodanobacter]KZC18272.1 transporter [Rhodanobacter sp. FW104-R8]KZC25769.1 transporter [Rhodanobacter sp. FW510-T8]KZC32976.1 transporter [Rhodanobacter sp. FW510-R10]